MLGGVEERGSVRSLFFCHAGGVVLLSFSEDIEVIGLARLLDRRGSGRSYERRTVALTSGPYPV